VALAQMINAVKGGLFIQTIATAAKHSPKPAFT